MRVFEAAKAPVSFDVIENFSMDNPEHCIQLKKNKNILIGNVGRKGSHYVENKQLYKFLELYVKGTVTNILKYHH